MHQVFPVGFADAQVLGFSGSSSARKSEAQLVSKYPTHSPIHPGHFPSEKDFTIHFH